MRQWWYRRVPTVVVLAGGLGLGLTVTYFFGLYLALVHGGYPGWRDWFVVRAPLLVLLPTVCLTAYLAVRSRVGLWLVERGAYEVAIEFASQRLRAGWLRAEAEAWRQHLAVVRAELALGNPRRALNVLDSETGRQVGGERPAWQVWRMELVRRVGTESDEMSDADDAVFELKAIESVEHDTDDRTAARLWAVTAELAVDGGVVGRDGGPSPTQMIDRGQQRIDGSDWWRLQLAEGVVLLGTSELEADWERAGELLASAAQPATEEAPGRAGEILALRAESRARLGDRDAARELLAEGHEGLTDPTSQRVLERVETRYGLEVEGAETEIEA